MHVAACSYGGVSESASLASSRVEAGMCYWINGGKLYLKLETRWYIGSLCTILGQRRNYGCVLPKESETQAPELPSRSDLRKICRSLKVIRDQSESDINPKIFQHAYKNWQEERKQKLTASTFASAVGFWPGRRFQLWLEKIGAIEPFVGNLATMWNNSHEQEAIEQYKLLSGIDSFRLHELVVPENGDDDWLAASPDGVVERLTVYGLPSRGVLEIKCPYFGGDNKKFSPWSRVPLYYIPQAQGLLEILDRDWMELYCWTKNGSSLFRIVRNEKYWTCLKYALSEFWWEHVVPGREELRRHVENPFEKLSNERVRDEIAKFPKSLLPAPRHELCSDLVVASRCIANEVEVLGRWDMPRRPYRMR